MVGPVAAVGSAGIVGADCARAAGGGREGAAAARVTGAALGGAAGAAVGAADASAAGFSASELWNSGISTQPPSARQAQINAAARLAEGDIAVPITPSQ